MSGRQDAMPGCEPGKRPVVKVHARYDPLAKRETRFFNRHYVPMVEFDEPAIIPICIQQYTNMADKRTGTKVFWPPLILNRMQFGIRQQMEEAMKFLAWCRAWFTKYN